MTPALLSGLVGFTQFLPGVALFHVAGIGVQPNIAALGLYFLVRTVGGIRLSSEILVWVLLGLLAATLATTVSVSPFYSLRFLVLQSGYLLLAAISFYLVFSTPRDARLFLNMYLLGALLSSIVGAAQYISSRWFGHLVSFTNNDNFSLVVPVDRGVGFTPEASILAMLLIPAVLIVWDEHGRRDSIVWPRLRTRFVLGLLGIGLLSTKSSTVLLVPVIAFLVELFASKDIRSTVRRSGRYLMLLAVIAIAFAPLYVTRLERSDAKYSMLGRLEKIEAGLRIFEATPVLGSGLGMVSEEVFFAPFVVERTDRSWSDAQEKKGVDSVLVRVLAESGFVGMLAMYYPLAAFFGPARAVLRRSDYRPYLIVSVALFFFQIGVSGYRDLAFFYFPVAAFAASAFLARQHSTQERQGIALYRGPELW